MDNHIICNIHICINRALNVLLKMLITIICLQWQQFWAAWSRPEELWCVFPSPSWRHVSVVTLPGNICMHPYICTETNEMEQMNYIAAIKATPIFIICINNSSIPIFWTRLQILPVFRLHLTYGFILLSPRGRICQVHTCLKFPVNFI